MTSRKNQRFQYPPRHTREARRTKATIARVVTVAKEAGLSPAELAQFLQKEMVWRRR